MNRIRIVLAVLFTLGLFVGLGGCVKQDFEPPKKYEIPLGYVMTIQDLQDFCPPGNVHKFTGDTSVVAVVAMDDKSGNLYKEVFIQDANSGAVARLQSSGGLYQGDSIYINLKGTTLKRYHKLFQIDSVHVDKNVVKRAVGKEVEPKLVTIPELKAVLDYTAQLIKLENVQFVVSDTSKTYADSENLEYGELTLQDEDGNTVLVRTSGYAKFADTNVPDGMGSIIAIASRYDDIVQLVIRKTSEVQFDQDRFTFTPPSGDFDDPFSVSYAIANNSGSGKWVQGYLVGVMETNVDPFTASFSGPFATNSNVLIANSPSETSVANCLIVQLPFGDIRTAVNLVTNSSNLGKEIKLRGNLTAYFSSPGMRDTDGYWLDGDGINPDDQIPSFFEENFTTTLGSFTAFNVVGAQVWEWENYDGGCAVMSGFEGQDFDNEDWLVSPEIDLSSRTNVNLNIREAINYFTSYNDMQVLISTDYDGVSAPSSSGNWTELTGFSRPAGNSWTFSNSGYIDISQYDGQKIYVGLKYTSSTSDAATWEVSQISLTEVIVD
jgi:hypothetical protein